MNEEASITVLEKGGFVSFANCGSPYFLAGRIRDERDLLVATPEKLRARFNIDARVGQEVTRIDRSAKEVEVRDLAVGNLFRLPYDKLILAPGATPIVPQIEHVNAPNVFLLRSMEDTRSIDTFLRNQAPKTAVIIGAGFIGLEMAEALRDRGLVVTLVEKAPHVLPPLDPEMAVAVTEELERHHVRMVAGRGLTTLHTRFDRVAEVEVDGGDRFSADVVLISIGVRPNTVLAHASGVILGPSGGIAVDAVQRTNDPDIYAVGDAAEAVHGVTGRTVRIPLAGPANRQGRTAGEHAATGSAPISGTIIGTAVVQVFDRIVAITGLSERVACAEGFDVDTAFVTANHHAGYYPGAELMRLKLIYDRKTGRILGAQAVGGAGVDKRIDVIATAIHFGGTVDDLVTLDLAYSPQVGSAKDPVHLLGMVAQNQLRGLMPALSPGGLNAHRLVDVRSESEFSGGSLHGAVNIPLEDLRHRLAELDFKAPTLVFCQGGTRGYVAERILAQNGFGNVRNLKGGISLAAEYEKSQSINSIKE
jgi:NADPH-dependent 2,4-dienoyl-CoA reductase/sulfur reductase-like enzyme/rhodanese-related sulfurtransferase